jgi:hypothetical protein
MNDWSAVAKQKVIIGELHAKATGRYGYRKVVESNLPFIGHRSDTLSWFMPGSRSVEIEGPITADIGYDMSVGQKIFSDDAQGILRETRDTVYLIVKTHYPEPKALNIQVKTFPKKSDSWFSGNISDTEFFNYTDTAGKRASNEILQKEQEFFMTSYANCIGTILYQTGSMLAHGKPLVIQLYVNGAQVDPQKNPSPKILDAGNIPLGKTFYN